MSNDYQRKHTEGVDTPSHELKHQPRRARMVGSRLKLGLFEQSIVNTFLLRECCVFGFVVARLSTHFVCVFVAQCTNTSVCSVIV